MLFILSDKIDSGKSTFCMECIDELIQHGISVNGWITPAHMIDGKKVGHDFVAIENSAIRDALPFTRRETFENSFPWKSWHFNDTAFKIAQDLPSPYDGGQSLFIMDEIGPLELDDGEGFFIPMKRALDEAQNSLVVLRSNITDKFLDGRDEFHRFSLAEQNALKALLLKP